MLQLCLIELDPVDQQKTSFLQWQDSLVTLGSVLQISAHRQESKCMMHEVLVSTCPIREEYGVHDLFSAHVRGPAK